MYPGCDPEHNRLNVSLRLLDIKAKSKSNDASLNMNLQYLHGLIPKGNTLPRSIDEAKKVVCPLDLPHTRYHACINDCIIYWNEDAEKIECHVCEEPRYKCGKKSPRKVVWYFPLIPRMWRYFTDKKEAKRMRWHADRKHANGTDGVLRHPADGSQWKAVACEYPEFAKEPRNLRLGMSTDGLNPFGNQSSAHSTWPMFVWMYNLSPWLCMKRKYIHMVMLIQGPTQPGNLSLIHI